MTDLTPRQTEILRLIQRTIAETGMPPTRAEIAEELGFRSANAAEDHLRALARKGVIALIPGASRGIQLKDTLREQMGLPKENADKIIRGFSNQKAISGMQVGAGWGWVGRLC